MKAKQFILTGVILLFSISTFAKNASVKGKVINNKLLNNIIFTEIQLQNLNRETIETQKLDENGNFKFNTTFDKFDFYLLSFDKRNYVAFFPEPGEETEITIDLNNLHNPTIVNSVQTQLFYNYNVQLISLRDKNKRAEIIKKMITEHPTSPVCILFVDQLNADSDYSYYEKLSKDLKPYASNELVDEFITRTKNIKNLKVGGQAPDIALKNPDGKIVKLSSLKGDYVLIDFWASWCRPCRMENPNNVKLYAKYHDKGFEIYGVSLDRDRDSWLKAIKDDNLTWPQVSDLKFWQSEGARIYNVRAIPHTVLLDKEGKIIATGLRGESLAKKLKEIFGE